MVPPHKTRRSLPLLLTSVFSLSISYAQVPCHNTNLTNIEKNLHKELTLSELADKVGYNKTYLVKKTKLLWGMSPMQYVNSVRLEKAKQLLSSTDMSITEIAESIGFKCIHYFSRNFKRNVGITPSEYHKKYWS